MVPRGLTCLFFFFFFFFFVSLSVGCHILFPVRLHCLTRSSDSRLLIVGGVLADRIEPLAYGLLVLNILWTFVD